MDRETRSGGAGASRRLPALLIAIVISFLFLRETALLPGSAANPGEPGPQVLSPIGNRVYLPMIAKPLANAGIFAAMLFGLGPEADQVEGLPLVTQSKLRILSCWFNGHADLDFFRGWHQSGRIASWWAQGYVLHVITWEQPTASPPTPYHTSSQYVQDMAELAGYLSGPADGKHVVLYSLATEFQTFVEPHNVYNGQTAGYYDRLQAKVLLARERIRSIAPNALVSLSWGGWQTQWDAPADGGGMSMIPSFAQTMRQMDFVSFQAMQTTYPTTVNDIRRNAEVFSAYNPHLMVSHYKPDQSQSSVPQAMATLDAEVRDFFTPEFTSYVRARGLFAFSFMSAELIQPATAQAIVDGINTFTVLP